MKIGCTGCGECCRQVGRVLEEMKALRPGDRYYDEFRAFPYTPGPDGACSELRDDNSCGVYDSRPALCDSQALYDRYFAEMMSDKEFEIQSAFACNRLIRQAGLGKEYMVKVEVGAKKIPRE